MRNAAALLLAHEYRDCVIMHVGPPARDSLWLLWVVISFRPIESYQEMPRSAVIQTERTRWKNKRNSDIGNCADIDSNTCSNTPITRNNHNRSSSTSNIDNGDDVLPQGTVWWQGLNT